ncbi:hypothetical protein D3C86_1808380 [compost metagenome]
MDFIGERLVFLPIFIRMSEDKIHLGVTFPVNDSSGFAMPLRITVNINHFSHLLMGAHRCLDSHARIFIGKVPIIIRHCRSVILLRMNRANSALLQSFGNI